MAAQFTLFDLLGDPTFLANPYTGGSCHSKGCAVDVTLVDAAGRELELPSGFDDFTGAGSRHNAAMSAVARRNMDLLTTVMAGCGFRAINDEWWHYDDLEMARYDLVELELDAFDQKTQNDRVNQAPTGVF
jgi:D-alanyl-D-alanine dipeptidase